MFATVFVSIFVTILNQCLQQYLYQYLWQCCISVCMDVCNSICINICDNVWINICNNVCIDVCNSICINIIISNNICWLSTFLQTRFYVFCETKAIKEMSTSPVLSLIRYNSGETRWQNSRDAKSSELGETVCAIFSPICASCWPKRCFYAEFRHLC